MTIFLIVAFIHFLFIFYSKTRQQNDLRPIVENGHKAETMKVQLRKNIKKLPKKGDNKNKPPKLSFQSLREHVNPDMLTSFESERGSMAKCLDELVYNIGSFPRSFYHREITGSSELHIQVSRNKVTLNLPNNEHWLIGGLVCTEMQELMAKLNGNTCLKSLVRENSVYQFTYRLTLSLGQLDSDEFSVSKMNRFHRRISRMAKSAAWQPIKLITNIGSALEFFESDAEKRDWDNLQQRLRLLDCRSLRINI